MTLRKQIILLFDYSSNRYMTAGQVLKFFVSTGIMKRHEYDKNIAKISYWLRKLTGVEKILQSDNSSGRTKYKRY